MHSKHLHYHGATAPLHKLVLDEELPLEALSQDTLGELIRKI